MLLNSGSLLLKHEKKPPKQVPPMASNRIVALNMRALNNLLTFLTLGLLIPNLAVGQQTANKQEITKQAVQKAYEKHEAKIRELLPPYSGAPLLLDLYHKSLDDGLCDPQQHTAWEARFDGIMGSQNVTDPGFSKPSEATGTAFTTIDTFEPVYSLPAKRSTAVVIAKPIAGQVCIPQSRKYVYTKFTLTVLKQFKPTHSNDKQTPEAPNIIASSYGGSVRFPSGYLETFLWSERGFIEIGKEYILFLWKPVPSDKTLVISQAYLIQQGLVFPVSTDGDAQTVYTKIPLSEFESRVKTAVEQNVNTNGLGNPRASR